MKDSLNIEGKVYISSRRGAEMSKYSNDYIGQLCRAGKVKARMMGRIWFVEQESLLAHKRLSDEAFKARCKGVVYPTPEELSLPQEEIKIMPESVIEGVIKKAEDNANANTNEPVPALDWKIAYSSDDRPLLPTLKTAELKEVATVQANIATPTIAPVISPSIYRTQRLAVMSSLVVLAVVIGLGAIFLPSIISNSNDKQVAGVGQGQLNGGSATSTAHSTKSASTSWNGIAITPSLMNDDKFTEERIRNSFSDQVEIKPDESGTAGVITPVFKQTKGDEFVYVLVPVKDGKSQRSP